jgi:hypothetical protein
MSIEIGILAEKFAGMIFGRSERSTQGSESPGGIIRVVYKVLVGLGKGTAQRAARFRLDS